MFNKVKQDLTKLVIFFMVASIIMIILTIILIVKVSKPSVTNNYNIEHVDTVVIQDGSEKPIISEQSN